MDEARRTNLVRWFKVEEGFEAGGIRVRVIGPGKKARLLIQAPPDIRITLIEATKDAHALHRRNR